MKVKRKNEFFSWSNMALTKSGFKTNFGLKLGGRETVERGEQKEKRREEEEEEEEEKKRNRRSSKKVWNY